MTEKEPMTPSELAQYSARFLLTDLYHEAGLEKMAELTGMPMGVIVSAFENIFGPNETRIREFFTSRFRQIIKDQTEAAEFCGECLGLYDMIDDHDSILWQIAREYYPD